MVHRTAHPVPVAGCFGCKVLGVGFDAGHVTRTSQIAASPDGAGGVIVEHRDGRQDATVHAPSVRVRTTTREDRC